MIINVCFLPFSQSGTLYQFRLDLGCVFSGGFVSFPAGHPNHWSFDMISAMHASLCCAILISMPIGLGTRTGFWWFCRLRFFHYSPTHRLEVLSCFGLFFCRLLFIVLACTMTGFVLMRTNFLEAAVVEESLESRHVRFFLELASMFCDHLYRFGFYSAAASPANR